MKSCFLTHCKRFGRYLPGAILALLILLGGLVLALQGFSADQQSQNQLLRVGMTGTAENTYLQWGLEALRQSDVSRYTIEFVELSEEQARQALADDELDAYVVIPQGFAEDALAGHIRPLRFVVSPNASGLVTMLQKEVTQVISTLLLESQRGVYGLGSAMAAQSLSGRVDHMNTLALHYVEFVLARDRLYSLESLGIRDGLGLSQYLLCGLWVLFLLLACLPFGPLLLRHDLGCEKMLAARGRSPLGQCLCELAAFGLCLLLSGGLLSALIPGVGLTGLWQALPVVLLCACFSYFLFSLTAHTVGGMVLHFFVCLGLCFVCGCMYPAYFFPEAVQQLGAWLPPALARTQLAGLFVPGSQALLPLLGYSLVFGLGGAALKARRIRRCGL